MEISTVIYTDRFDYKMDRQGPSIELSEAIQLLGDVY